MTTAVECKLIREGGTFASIGTTEYHFAPQPDGAHVAFIDDEEHADVFLSIPEGYRLYRGDIKPAAKAEAPAVTAAVAEAIVEAAAIEPEPEVVTMLGSGEDDAKPVVQPEAAAKDEREELFDQVEALYGERPHARTGVKKLREMIAAKQTV